MATKDELSLARIFRALWEHAEKDRELLRATLKDLDTGGRLGQDTHDLIKRVLEETDI